MANLRPISLSQFKLYSKRIAQAQGLSLTRAQEIAANELGYFDRNHALKALKSAFRHAPARGLRRIYLTAADCIDVEMALQATVNGQSGAEQMRTCQIPGTPALTLGPLNMLAFLNGSLLPAAVSRYGIYDAQAGQWVRYRPLTRTMGEQHTSGATLAVPPGTPARAGRLRLTWTGNDFELPDPSGLILTLEVQGLNYGVDWDPQKKAWYRLDIPASDALFTEGNFPKVCGAWDGGDIHELLRNTDRRLTGIDVYRLPHSENILAAFNGPGPYSSEALAALGGRVLACDRTGHCLVGEQGKVAVMSANDVASKAGVTTNSAASGQDKMTLAERLSERHRKTSRGRRDYAMRDRLLGLNNPVRFALGGKQFFTDIPAQRLLELGELGFIDPHGQDKLAPAAGECIEFMLDHPLCTVSGFVYGPQAGQAPYDKGVLHIDALACRASDPKTRKALRALQRDAKEKVLREDGHFS